MIITLANSLWKLCCILRLILLTNVKKVGTRSLRCKNAKCLTNDMETGNISKLIGFQK